MRRRTNLTTTTRVATVVVAGAMAVLARSHTGASEGMPSPDCAYRDVDATTAIEDGGERGLPAEQLSKAADIQIEARRLCNKGQVGESLALYDRIITMGSHLSRKSD